MPDWPAMLEDLPGPIRLLLALTAPPGVARGDVRPSAADWQALPGLAAWHGLVLPALRGLPDDGVPDEVRAAVKAAAEQRARRALAVAAELVRLGRLLSGMPLIALKGSALAIDLYGDATARDPGDVDLLVPPERVRDADAALTAAGYVRRGPSQLTDAFLAVKLAAAGDLEYERPGAATLDLHWRWHRNPHLLRFDAEAVWRGRRVVSVAGAALGVLGPAEQLVYLASHGARHGWARLKWLNDLRWLLAKPETRAVLPAAAERARRWGGGPALAEAVAMVEAVDGGSSHRGLGRWSGIGRRQVFGGMRLAELAAEWRLSDGWAARWRGIVLHRLLAGNEHDAAMLALPRRLHALYPVLRPLFWCVRRVTK